MKQPRTTLVSLLSLLAVGMWSADPLTVTAWDVRKEADEILEDLSKSGQDRSDVLVRIARLLEEHGSDLISVRTGSSPGAAPIATIIAERLVAAGLNERFINDNEPGAARRLNDMLAARVGVAELSALARSVPGTATAGRCWRRIADLAWDAGNLRLFRDASYAGGDATDPSRKARQTAAAALASNSISELPATLDGLDKMWQVDIGQRVQPAAAQTTDRRGMPQEPEQPARLWMSPCGDGAIALSDGRRLLVLDHLVGNILGAAIPVGQQALPPQSARPEPVSGGAVAVGMADQHLVLVCAASNGTQRWIYTGKQAGVESVSAPLAVDGLVAVAYRDTSDTQVALRLLAVSARDGSLLWDVVLAQLTTNRWNLEDVAPPTLARHARGIAVLANAGLLGLVGTDGAVRRLWSYPSPLASDLVDARSRHGRRGLIASDGNTVVATPADNPGLVLVLSPDDGSPRPFRGDGADGDVLAVHGDDALLAGGKAVLLDVRRLRLRWSVPTRLTDAQGILGDEYALLGGNNQFQLVTRKDGKTSVGKALAKPCAISYRDGVLIMAHSDEIHGFGNATAFLARLREAAQQASVDPKPHASLAAVLAG
ncbi:MAG: PQQ-binding-like beta-propeller repeat protein, partial [Planctomycetota bacterium]